MIRLLRSPLLIIVTAMVAVAPALAAAEVAPIRVFAAASLKNALDGIILAWHAGDDGARSRVLTTHAATSTLARQVAVGAPADIVVFASEQWAAWLTDQGAGAGAPLVIAGNRLVVITPRPGRRRAGLNDTQHARFKLVQGDFEKALGNNGRLALAQVDTVPAGIYARQALENLGMWHGLAHRTAQAANARAALALVSTGAAPLGIVYRSDALSDQRVEILATVPEEMHDPVRYLAVSLGGSTHPQANDFLGFMQTGEARDIFIRNGFTQLAAD